MTNVTTGICEAVVDRIENSFISVILLVTVCTVCNIFLLVVIKQTPTLQGLSGLLLRNDQVVNFLENIVFLTLMTLTSLEHGNNQPFLSLTLVGYYGAVVRQTGMSLSLFLLLGIRFNLYVAICKRVAYSRVITVKRGYIFIIISWIVSLTLGLSPLFGGSGNGVCYDLTSLWLTVLHLMYGIGSLAGTAWFLHEVLKHRRSQGSLSYSTQEKVKLTKFILILSMSNTLIFIGLNLADCFRVSLASSIGTYIVYVIHVVSRAYSVVRPCFHLVLYRPLWETAKALLRCRPIHAPNSVGAAGTNQIMSISGPEDNSGQVTRPTPTWIEET